MSGLRARVRAEMLVEITQIARKQIATDGAASLSLRAIARELGVASSALYRYFPSRDSLLTALIIESFDHVGSAVEAAEAAVPRNDFAGRWRASAHALRDWALAHPAEYGLIFGTPVPGYVAPPDIEGPAHRHAAVLVRIEVEMFAAGIAPELPVPTSPALIAECAALKQRLSAPIPDAMLLAGMSAWMTILGAISLEVFGHLCDLFDDPGVHFAALVETLGMQMSGGRMMAGA